MPATFNRSSFLKLFAGRVLLLVFCVLTLLPLSSKAQVENEQEYEDITVFLMVQNVGGYEIDAVYLDDNIYVNVETLFRILKINHTLSSGNKSISGFFLNEENLYSVNTEDLKARVGDTEFTLLPADFVSNDLGLYLKNNLFGKFFGLNLNFNFRSLSLELKTTVELPIIKELRQEQMRKNIDRLGGKVEVDTTIGREYHFFRGGMADWSVISTQTSGRTTDTRAILAAGAELFGGEATGMMNYSSITGFDERQQQYRWRWANNDAKIIRQVQLGKIPLRATSSIYAPFIGASITNTPTTFRRSFGSYTLTDQTEPGWTVELYINNVIVDFTTADASGFFTFNVPLVYGSSQVTLKFYGPWGEERVREQTITIPYNFLPPGTMEYNITGGVVRDSMNSAFTRVESMVGIHRNITMGAGVEYLSALKQDRAMPFIIASARFLKYFLLTGEYTHGVRSRGLLNYRLPSNLVLEIDYTKYVPGQKAISFNYLEERKAGLSVPIRIGTFRSFARLIYRQNVLPLTTFSSAEAMLSSYVKGVSTNISAYANWLPEGKPYIYSNISLGFRIGRSVNFRPQAQFDLTNKAFISYKAELEKNFSQRAHLSLVYEENVRSKTRNVEVSFRYDLPFAQTAASARISDKYVTTTESARGSFAFGSGNGYVHADSRGATGRGGITITPFLDLNNNDIKEDDEPIATGLSVRLNGGRILKLERDSLIRILELEPYASYLLELDDTGFENIAWQLNLKTISVQIDPNQFKKVGIPIKVKGEVNGMIYLKKGRSSAGLGRIIINIRDEKEKAVTRILSESDGYFNYLGLPPGNYTASPDSAQLNRLGYSSSPGSFDFTISPSVYGDIIDDITFTLTSVKPAVEEVKPGAEGSPPAEVGPDKQEPGDPRKQINKGTDSKTKEGTSGQLNKEGTQSKEGTSGQFNKEGAQGQPKKDGTSGEIIKEGNQGQIKNEGVTEQLNKKVPAGEESDSKEFPTGQTPSKKETDNKIPGKAEEVAAQKTKQPETGNTPDEKDYGENWFVQAGAYIKLYHARNMYVRLKEMGYDATIQRIPPYHKVRILHYTTEQEARQISEKLKSTGIDTFIGK